MANSFKKMYLISEYDFKLLQDYKQGNVQGSSTMHQRDVDVKNALSMNKRLEVQANEQSNKDDGRNETVTNETSMEDTSENNTNASYASRDDRPRPESPMDLPPLEPTPKKSATPPPRQLTPLASSSPAAVPKRRTRATAPLDASYHSLSIDKSDNKKTTSHESKAVGTKSPKESIYKIISDYAQSPIVAKHAIDIAKLVLEMPATHVDWQNQRIFLDNETFTLIQFIDIVTALSENMELDGIQKLNEFVKYLKTNSFPVNMIRNTHIKLRYFTDMKGTPRKGAMAMTPRSPISWFNSMKDIGK